MAIPPRYLSWSTEGWLFCTLRDTQIQRDRGGLDSLARGAVLGHTQKSVWHVTHKILPFLQGQTVSPYKLSEELRISYNQNII